MFAGIPGRGLGHGADERPQPRVGKVLRAGDDASDVGSEIIVCFERKEPVERRFGIASAPCLEDSLTIWAVPVFLAEKLR